MDTKHRHDLEENDLEQFLANFKEWWAKHGTGVLTSVLVVLVVVVGYRFLKNRAVEAHDKAYRDLETAPSPTVLSSLAAESSDPQYQAQAYLRAGDLLLNKASLPSQTGELPADERAKLLKDAEGNYQQVLHLSPANPAYKLNARLGLASVAEDRIGPGGPAADAEVQRAKEQYETVLKEAGELYPAHARLAAARLALLPELVHPVVFAPDPLPSFLPTTQPGAATQPGATTRPGAATQPAEAAPRATQPAKAP